VFPLTKPYHGPDDQLGHKVARLLLSPSPTLDRLCRGIYFNDLPDDATGRIECAFRLVLKTTGIERKLRDARKAGQLLANDDAIAEEALKKNIIGKAEFDLLQETKQAVRNAILVDEFSTPGWKLETP
jgi:acyl-CoA dehydrogenase